MKNLQEKEKNLTPGKLTFTSTPPQKSFGPKTLLRLLILVFGLAIAAGAVWLLFALNRPGIEIKASTTPLPATAAHTAQPDPGQATTVSSAPGPTPTQVIAIQNSVSRPTQQPALGPTQTPAPAQGSNSGSAQGSVQVPTPVIGTSNTKIQGYGVVTSKELNMRSAPNTDATVIKSLKSGEIVELTSRSGGWYQTVEGLWISASFLEVRQTRSEAESYAREFASS